MALNLLKDKVMKKLLIVDDQKMYLLSLEVALRKSYEVTTAQNYNEAVEKLKGDVDMALLDIRLDGKDESNIDGLKLLEWIQMNKPEVTAYVMSAYREFNYAEQALNMGAKHFFRKPIDIIGLIAILREKG